MIEHSHTTFVEGCFRCELSRDEVEEEPRWVKVALGGPAGPLVTICLWCGCVVEFEVIHIGRCYGELKQSEDADMVQEHWEEDIVEGLHDDE